MKSQTTWAIVDALYTLEGESQGQLPSLGATFARASVLNNYQASPFSFRWRFNPHYESFVARTVDLVIEPRDVDLQAASEAEFAWPHDLREGLGTNTSTVRAFVEDAFKKNKRSSSAIGIKLILPGQSGFVARSDIIELRMHGCRCATAASGFMQPRQYIERFATHKTQHGLAQLYDILSGCIGAVVVDSLDFESTDRALDGLEDAFRYRLALEFLLPDAIARKRVAIVHCPRHELLTYEAIRCLGVDLVVLDQPGHFLEDPKGPLAYLRESFYPIDFNVDDGLPQRIVNVAKDLELDGIFSRFDLYSAQVAVAAQLLGLPTSPHSAYSIATDKYAARMSEAEQNGAVCVNSGDELEQRLRNPEKPLNIQYPIVVKPCMGWSSHGVAKARDEKELIAAVRNAHSSILGHDGDTPIQPRVMIEQYVDGPEVDINFALWDGEVVFSDISDDFPSHGDVSDETGGTDFQETSFVYPSKLPKLEKDMLRRRLRDCVLRMGFRTGVIHCEARVKNSAMKYCEQDGIIDLDKDLHCRRIEPSAFMIEVNPRPPGYFGLHAITWTYGVDYYMLHVLRCVMDEKRFRALAVPFSKNVQHAIAVLNLSPEKGGILRSPDPAIRLSREKPSIMDSVSLYRNFFELREYVTPPDAVEATFLAVLIVESRTGRKDLLRKLEEIREEWIPIIE